MINVFTIGVYGSTENSFFEKLAQSRIDLFCDIRQRRGVRGSQYKYVNSNYYNSLTETAKKQMVTYEWSTGAVVENNNDLAGQISDENSRKWRGNIALPTLSEYLRTNSLSNCKTFYSYSSYDVGYSNICGDTTWMAIEDYPWWTLTPNASTSDYVFDVAAYAVIGDNYVDNRYADHFGVRPVLYLSSNVKITGGTGTQSDPYTIE